MAEEKKIPFMELVFRLAAGRELPGSRRGVHGDWRGRRPRRPYHPAEVECPVPLGKRRRKPRWRAALAAFCRLTRVELLASSRFRWSLPSFLRRGARHRPWRSASRGSLRRPPPRGRTATVVTAGDRGLRPYRGDPAGGAEKAAYRQALRRGEKGPIPRASCSSAAAVKRACRSHGHSGAGHGYGHRQGRRLRRGSQGAEEAGGLGRLLRHDRLYRLSAHQQVLPRRRGQAHRGRGEKGACTCWSRAS